MLWLSTNAKVYKVEDVSVALLTLLLQLRIVSTATSKLSFEQLQADSKQQHSKTHVVQLQPLFTEYF